MFDRITKPTYFIILLTLIFNYQLRSFAQKPSGMRVVGYYCGNTIPVDSFEVEKLTHIIFSFGGLRGNQFYIHSAIDSATIKRMVQLKSQNPDLKVMLSIGGWGGCKNCSDVFSTEAGRKEFAQSVKNVSDYFHTDGIDLDWEYPAIKGFPGYKYSPSDRENFTELVKEIRKVNSAPFEISFAAGGFTTYIDSSIAWKKIIQYTDFINLMSYDLVHGFSRISGHHTPLYSTPQQKESADHAVQMLLKRGVPAEKIVIGSGFYCRLFQIEKGSKVDLYQPCKFIYSFPSKYYSDSLTVENGFVKYWDDVAKAPYAINEKRRIVATYDDERSLALKTKYVAENKLGGMMFWQLYDDKFHNGLLETIFENK